jgi:hypothetical protein
MIWLAVRLLPPHVIMSCRLQATAWLDEQKTRPTSRIGAVVIMAIWLILIGWAGWYAYQH